LPLQKENIVQSDALEKKEKNQRSRAHGTRKKEKQRLGPLPLEKKEKYSSLAYAMSPWPMSIEKKEKNTE
jgi:hypothetical protein